MRAELKILHLICFALLLGSGDSQDERLTAIGKDFPIEALRAEDVTIPCLLSGVPTPLNLHKVSVVWYHMLPNGKEEEVYIFAHFQHEPLRPGSHMNDSDLEQGDASLYIPSIQIKDEGDYRCFVIVTPDSASARSTLQVSAKPQTTLKPDTRVAGLLGSIYCEVSNVYPEDVKIRWVQYNKRDGTNSTLDKDIYFTMPFKNPDGTFHVSSMVTMNWFTGTEPGDVFSCIVSHKSLKEETVLSFTFGQNTLIGVTLAFLVLSTLLFIKIFLDELFNKEWRHWMEVINVAIIISILGLLCYILYFFIDFRDKNGFIYALFADFGCLSICFGLLLCLYGIRLWKYFKEDKPSISKISGDIYIPHLKRTTLTCQITNFRRKEIQINVYLSRRNDKKRLISSWESTDCTASNDLERSTAGGREADNSNALPLLAKGAEHSNLLSVKMEVKITKSCTGKYKCDCSISITPSADTDKRALLVVEVEHSTLKWPISKSRTLNVHKGSVPTVSNISGDRWIPHMERTTLSCQITGPKKIKIHLYLKRRNDIKNHLIRSWMAVDCPSGTDNITAGHQSGDTINAKSPLQDAVHDTMLQVEMETVMTKTGNEEYKFDCSFFLTPNADTDDGAELTMKVHHPVLKCPIYKYRMLNVIQGGKPSLWRRWRSWTMCVND